MFSCISDPRTMSLRRTGKVHNIIKSDKISNKCIIIFAQISANGNVELSCRIRLNRFVQVDQSSPQSTWPSFTLEEKDYWFLLECSPNCLYLKGALRFLTENLAKKTSVTHCKWSFDLWLRSCRIKYQGLWLTRFCTIWSSAVLLSGSASQPQISRSV